MKPQSILKTTINRINQKGYKAYKDLRGSYHFEEEQFVLHIDHVQGDPFASPSKIRIELEQKRAGFPPESYANRSREIATRDFLARNFAQAIRTYAKGNRGSGKSGHIQIDEPGQEVLERTAVFITQEKVEVRFTIGLPAFGRKIAGNEAQAIFFDEIPALVEHGLCHETIDPEQLRVHYETCEDADHIRSQLRHKNLVAFVANDSILPRRSGIDPRPMDSSKAIPFVSPPSLQVEMDTPNHGKLKGMAIPTGITLIVGGGFHGKSTLLQALENGIYNHIHGDGRERVLTEPGAVKIRSEDGRRIEKVDISPFINNLPLAKPTRTFSTEDASGSTSQAANIIESMEAGARTLLIDEDTSASNFMIRDRQMQQLIHKEHEPITPFVDKIRPLKKDYGISTILVMGGSGDYFTVADLVIGMNHYSPSDLTKKAKQIVAEQSQYRKEEGELHFGSIQKRRPQASSIQPGKGKKPRNIKIHERKLIQLGTFSIDLSAIEQLADASQTRAIAEALVYAKQYMDGNQTLEDLLSKVMEDIQQKGLQAIGLKHSGNYAAFRKQELAATLNRLRSLQII